MTANRESRSTNREPRSRNVKREAQMTANREPRTKNANVPLGHGRPEQRESYRGREVHSRFPFAVRGSPSFVPRVFRLCFAVRGSQSFVPRVFRSCFAVRASRFAVRASRFAVRSVPRISTVADQGHFENWTNVEFCNLPNNEISNFVTSQGPWFQTSQQRLCSL